MYRAPLTIRAETTDRPTLTFPRETGEVGLPATRQRCPHIRLGLRVALGSAHFYPRGERRPNHVRADRGCDGKVSIQTIRAALWLLALRDWCWAWSGDFRCGLRCPEASGHLSAAVGQDLIWPSVGRSGRYAPLCAVRLSGRRLLPARHCLPVVVWALRRTGSMVDQWREP
jgi:hypothetical protein